MARTSTPAALVGRRLTALAGASLAFALAACSFSQPPPPPPVMPAPAAEAAPAPKPPPHKPSPPAQTLANLPPSTAPDRAPAAAPRTAVVPEPLPNALPGAPPGRGGFDRLIGRDQPGVTELLGEPLARAESPPATIWRYVAAACDLDVYFYLDLQSQAMRALHYEVRSHDLPERSAQRCYDDVVGERHAHGESTGGSDRPR